jgi:hypothetical protein
VALSLQLICLKHRSARPPKRVPFPASMSPIGGCAVRYRVRSTTLDNAAQDWTRWLVTAIMRAIHASGHH